MILDVTQRIAVARTDVVDALVDAGWYASIGASPGLGAPEPLSLTRRDGVVRTSVRWRYAGTLPPAAARLLEPEKMTWVIEMRLDETTSQGTVHVVPDHYEGLLTFEATVTFEVDGTATLERVRGPLTVKIPLFGDTVERAIATGFEEHLRTQATALDRYCNGTLTPG